MSVEDQQSDTVSGTNETFDTLLVAMQKFNEDDLAGAIDICKGVMNSHPDDPKPFFVMAIIAFKIKDLGQALQMVGTAHELAPDVKEYIDALASISARAGRLADAVYYAKLSGAAESDPQVRSVMPTMLADFDASMRATAPSTHIVDAEGALNLADFETAQREFAAELRINPDNTQALMGMARSALALGRQTLATGALQTLLRLEPDNAMATALLARALARLGRTSEAEAVAMRALDICDGDAEIYLQAMAALQTIPSVGPEHLKEIASSFAEEFEQQNAMDDVEPVSASAESQIHLGFVSNAFYRNELSEFFANWFDVGPPKNHVVSGYQQSVASDAMTSRLVQGCNNWRKVFDIDPWTMTVSLNADRLDALVDISQPDAPTNATVMGIAPCPVRVGVSALPEPGLMPGITHILTDETMQAADRSMLLEGQELITVEGTLFARQPYSRKPADAPAPASVKGVVTFGVMARLPQLSPVFARLLSDVLLSMPNAQLLLYGGNKGSEESRVTIREYFLNAGISDRIHFVDLDPDEDTEDTKSGDFGRLSVHTSFWKEVDIFVDSYPMNGQAEICEALWHGVPTVTLRGDRRLSCVGASILAAAGRPNWIARSSEEFKSTIGGLARDIDRLAEERNALLKIVPGSALFSPRVAFERIRFALLETAKRHRSQD